MCACLWGLEPQWIKMHARVRESEQTYKWSRIRKGRERERRRRPKKPREGVLSCAVASRVS